jgi:hypothetical protein
VVELIRVLAAVTLSWSPDTLPGCLDLHSPSFGRIKVWNAPTDGNELIGSDGGHYVRPANPGRFPTTVWVEGISPGNAPLYLYHRSDCDHLESTVTEGADTITVVSVNVDVGLLESQEEDPGLYINANWDDDDHDGWTDNEVPPNATYTPDKDDPYVYDIEYAQTGDSDFRTFWVDVEPSGLDGYVELTYSNGLAVWETMTKKKPSGESSFVPSGTPIPAEDLPALLYVEGVSGSAAFRDKEIRATYCGATDVAKLTVFEVDLTGFFGYGDQQTDNERKHSSFGGSSDHNGMISWDDADADGVKDDPDPHCTGFSNCMECQGTVKPSGVTTQVTFDFKRDRWGRGWRKLAGGVWIPLMDAPNPWSPDDDINSDEDLSVSSGQHIYSIDGPGWPSPGCAPGLYDYLAIIWDFREYVVINIGGTWYQCSNYCKWHSKVYTEPVSESSSYMTRSAMSLQALGEGWITVPDNP